MVRIRLTLLVAGLLGLWGALGGQVLWSASGGWTQAEPGYAFEFPRDHASHPSYRVEWWYYTGNLKTREGRRFGYQLTFFRVGIDMEPSNPSTWAVRDLHMAHLALTDLGRNRSSRGPSVFNRDGVGWAGAATDRFDVWNEGWRASLADDGVGHVLRAHDDRARALRLSTFVSIR